MLSTLISRLFSTDTESATFFKNAWRIFFHTSVGGNPTGIGELVQRCNNAGVPVSIKAADGTAGISDVLALPTWNAPHQLIYRTSVVKEGMPPPNNTPNNTPDVPNYSNDAKEEALAHFNWHELSWPAELKAEKDRVWFEITNEVDKNQAEWLAEFFLEVHEIALQRGYMISMFGWSMGEPEPEHWQGQKMLELLRVVGDNPDTRSIALHEYSGTINGIFTKQVDGEYIVTTRDDPDFGYLVGRFSALHDVCDQNGIKRPKIHITEFGWSYDDAPAVDVAMAHIEQAQALYNEHQNIMMAALWWLGPEFGNIANKIQPLIEPVGDRAVVTEYVPGDVVEPPPVEDCRGKPRVNYKRTMLTVPQDVTLEYWLGVCREAFENKNSVAFSYDDAGIGDLDDKTAVLYRIPEEKHQEFLDWYGEHYPFTKVEFRDTPNTNPGDPFEGLKFGQPIDTNWMVVSGGEFNALRNYSEFGGSATDSHEGRDSTPLGINPHTLNVYPGVVVAKGTSAGYGNNVTIRHEFNGIVFTTRRAHFEVVTVDIGQVVGMGAVLGRTGTTGFSSGVHDHLTMQSVEYGMDGYIVPNVVDPIPYFPLPPGDGGNGGDYTGPSIEGGFVEGIDQPASDWHWDAGKAVFDVTGLTPKFHTQGTNPQWYPGYKGNGFNVVRILMNRGFTNRDPMAIYNEFKNDLPVWWNMGVRDFILLNEPNTTHESLGKLWDNGTEFGHTFRILCSFLKLDYPGIRIWFPGCSPGYGAQYQFIDDAKNAGAFDYIYGMTEHVYTGVSDNSAVAANIMVDEVNEFRSKYAMTRPLIIGEFAVNVVAGAEYKRDVYKNFFAAIKDIEGIQGAYSFTSTWHPDPDPTGQGWLEAGIYAVW